MTRSSQRLPARQMRGDVLSTGHGNAAIRVGMGVLLVSFALLLSCAAGADHVAGGVPFPRDAKISTPPSTAPLNHRRFVGAWIGAWEDAIQHVLIVESILPNGQAQVVYAVGENPWANVPAAWHRHDAWVSGDVLRISKTFNAAYRLDAGDTLTATWWRGSSRALAKLSRTDLGALTRGEPSRAVMIG